MKHTHPSSIGTQILMVIFIRLLLDELNQHVVADPSQEEMKICA
jgi:cytochrome b561